MKKKEIYQIQFVGETRRGNDRVGTTWSCEVFGICPLHKVTNKMKEKKTLKIDEHFKHRFRLYKFIVMKLAGIYNIK